MRPSEETMPTAKKAPRPAWERRIWAVTALRLVLPSALTVALFLIAIFLFILPELHDNIMARKREMIQELVRTAIDTLAFYDQVAQQGEMTEADAQEMARRQIRERRYGNEMKDYFWIHDLTPRVIMHPYRPDLEGQDVSNYADPHGKRLFWEMARLAEEKGSGYVSYMWQWKDDPKRVVPKLSFVELYKPWGWLVGTGIYLDDVDAEIASITRRFAAVSLGILAIVQLLYIYVIHHNIRAEKKRIFAEQQLTASRRMLRLVMDNIPQYIYWRDRLGRYLGCNRRFADALGLTDSEEIAGRDFLELPGLTEGSERQDRREMAVMAAGNPELHRIEPRRHPHGGWRWLDISRIPLKDEAGQTVGLLCTLEDISHRRAMEKDLKESERRFRALVEHSPVGIMILEHQRLAYLNPEARRLLGADEPGFAPEAWPVSDHPAASRLARLERELAGRENAWEEELRFYPHGHQNQPGALLVVRCRASRISHQGRPALLIIMLDTTRAQELEHLIKVQDKMASLGRVAAGIAHEVRNPLSGINMYLTALEARLADPEALEIIAKIQAAGRRIEGVVKRVLDFAKPGKPRLGWVNLRLCLDTALELSAVSLKKGKVELRVELPVELPPVMAEARLMEQVFVNLINNAAQVMAHQPPPRRLTITADTQGDRVRLCFADNGPGVPPELREQIFDPFFTLGGGGSGIGLAVCQRIIHDLGGSISVDEAPDGGALFVVRMPPGQYWGYDSHG